MKIRKNQILITSITHNGALSWQGIAKLSLIVQDTEPTLTDFSIFLRCLLLFNRTLCWLKLHLHRLSKAITYGSWASYSQPRSKLLRSPMLCQLSHQTLRYFKPEIKIEENCAKLPNSGSKRAKRNTSTQSIPKQF